MRDKNKIFIHQHFNKLWSSGRSPWQFSEDFIVKQKSLMLSPFINKSEKIIDLGCGGGEFMNYMIKNKTHLSHLNPSKMQSIKMDTNWLFILMMAVLKR